SEKKHCEPGQRVGPVEVRRETGVQCHSDDYDGRTQKRKAPRPDRKRGKSLDQKTTWPLQAATQQRQGGGREDKEVTEEPQVPTDRKQHCHTMVVLRGGLDDQPNPGKVEGK